MRIIADKDVCIGSGNCVFAAPEVFDQGDDGLVDVLEPVVAAGHEKVARDAVRRCPSGAISLSEPDGEA